MSLLTVENQTEKELWFEYQHKTAYTNELWVSIHPNARKLALPQAMPGCSARTDMENVFAHKQLGSYHPTLQGEFIKPSFMNNCCHLACGLNDC